MNRVVRNLLLLLAVVSLPVSATKDVRVLVEMPLMMQTHMLGNMRDHLVTINNILRALDREEFDKAADLAEQRLGMTSLESHGAAHMAKVMPKGMREIGTGMHHAASRFARIAQTGDKGAALKALTEVTGACVACHSGYRIR